MAVHEPADVLAQVCITQSKCDEGQYSTDARNNAGVNAHLELVMHSILARELDRGYVLARYAAVDGCALLGS
jgi:hypothetical protein